MTSHHKGHPSPTLDQPRRDDGARIDEDTLRSAARLGHLQRHRRKS
jgi:hypothetical protein